MAKLDEAAARELGTILLHFIGSALIIRPATNSPDDVVASGTFSYIDTGEKTLLVTCDHVVAEFEALLAEDEKMELRWGPGPGQVPIQLSADVPLDRNSSVDICTFGCPIPSNLQPFGKFFLKSPSWPPPRVEVGDTVIGIGFPGQHRETEIKEGQVGLALVASLVSGEVSTVSHRHFTVADEDCTRTSIQLGDKSFETSWGGMSGGVFFKVVGENHFELAGFMKEGGSKLVLDTDGTIDESEDAPKELNATLFISHADFILANGKLDHGLIPY